MNHQIKRGLHLLLKRASLFLLLCCCVALLPAQGQQLLQKNVQLKQAEGTLLEVLQELQQHQGVTFSYDESILPKKPLKFDKKSWQLRKLLKAIEAQLPIEFRYLNEQIILRKNKKGKVNFSGTIKVDGEQMPGATVYVPELNIGSATDANGYYSLLLPPGRYTSVFSFIGHQQENRTLDLSDDTSLNVNLYPSIDQLGEVVISATQNNEFDLLKMAQTGVHQIDIQQVKDMPMFVGETDIFKGIQALPGIQNSHVGTSNFSVRGGGYDHNLILLDGVPIYNTAHTLGFFSVFNTNALQSAQLYKGGLPAQYGGRLSSVLTLTTKEGNNEKIRVQGGIGVISSNLVVDGPIGKKVTFMVGGRYGYPSLLLNTINKPGAFVAPAFVSSTRNDMNFVDLNAKVKFKLDPKNEISITAFGSQDRFRSQIILPENTYDWYSVGGVINWKHRFNARLVSNIKLFHSQSHYANHQKSNLENTRWSNSIEQQGLKADLSYQFSANHQLNFGVALTHMHLNPGKLETLDENDDLVRYEKLHTKQPVESGIYFDHQFSWKKWQFNYGLRLSSLHNVGIGRERVYDNDQNLTGEKFYRSGEVMSEYYGWEPRASIRYSLNPNASLKASYTRTYQYLHQVGDASIGLPTDFWLPANRNVKPRFADQYSLGYFWTFGNEATYQFSAEAYYRQSHRVIDYLDNADLFMNDAIETQISTGDEVAYGLELMLKKKKGRLKGWLGYTWAKVERNIPGINNNQTYAPNYDRRHNLSLNATYDLGKRWRIAANFQYMSGAGITAPVGEFFYNNQLFNFYSTRNGHRLPDVHQLNLSIILRSKQQKRWQGEWALGVNNVYNRANAFSLSRPQTQIGNVHIYRQFTRMSLFGLMPYISYNFKF
ncbi:MAG TPA: hypothetical protein DCS93_10675 [Microscillaceae bacterium]|nr:hypothetical protein [Microscillaceae bacterium]